MTRRTLEVDRALVNRGRTISCAASKHLDQCPLYQSMVPIFVKSEIWKAQNIDTKIFCKYKQNLPNPFYSSLDNQQINGKAET